MKKMTSIIAIMLLAALLLTGCDFIPLKKDFSQYGFTFTIAGKVTEEEGNESGNAVFNTKYGKLTFANLSFFSAAIEPLVSSTCDSKETLENGARLYSYNAKQDINGVMVIETQYFVSSTDGTNWMIKFLTPEADYNKDAIIKVFTSVEFVTAG